MIKHIVAIVAFSLVVILGMPHVQIILQSLLTAHDWISTTLTQVFSGGDAGNLTRNLIALMVIPVLVGFVPAIIYWLAKRQWFPYFMQTVWITWLVQTAALVVLYKVAT
jgi:hypothetical protein